MSSEKTEERREDTNFSLQSNIYTRTARSLWLLIRGGILHSVLTNKSNLLKCLRKPRDTDRTSSSGRIFTLYASSRTQAVFPPNTQERAVLQPSIQNQTHQPFHFSPRQKKLTTGHRLDCQRHWMFETGNSTCHRTDLNYSIIQRSFVTEGIFLPQFHLWTFC